MFKAFAFSQCCWHSRFTSEAQVTGHELVWIGNGVLYWSYFTVSPFGLSKDYQYNLSPRSHFPKRWFCGSNRSKRAPIRNLTKGNYKQNRWLRSHSRLTKDYAEGTSACSKHDERRNERVSELASLISGQLRASKHQVDLQIGWASVSWLRSVIDR